MMKRGDVHFFNTKLPTSALIFTDLSDADALEIEEKFGVMVFTQSEITKTGFLFQNGLELFVKGKKKEWNFLNDYSHPFNAMVISDAYLLCKTESVKNLEALLLNWLPKKLSITFDLTIISDRDNRNQPSDILKIKNELTALLESNFPYKVNVSIIIAKIHDRNLITNYIWCSSGYGFELINNGESCRNTHLAILPVTHIGHMKMGYKSSVMHSKTESAVLDLFTSLKTQFNVVTEKAKNGIPNSVLQDDVAGNKQNRLFRN
jgi:hypothetical protein